MPPDVDVPSRTSVVGYTSVVSMVSLAIGHMRAEYVTSDDVERPDVKAVAMITSPISRSLQSRS
jgi:hypothetical protein